MLRDLHRTRPKQLLLRTSSLPAEAREQREQCAILRSSSAAENLQGQHLSFGVPTGAAHRVTGKLLGVQWLLVGGHPGLSLPLPHWVTSILLFFLGV